MVDLPCASVLDNAGKRLREARLGASPLTGGSANFFVGVRLARRSLTGRSIDPGAAGAVTGAP